MTNALERKRRRLPQHDWQNNSGVPHYVWCTYPDPDNAVSGICGMTAQWHERDAEERAAEDAEPNGLAAYMNDQIIAKDQIVTYDEAKAAARALTGSTQINPDIDKTAAWDLLRRWGDQNF